jgi:hypothetical protein
MARGDTAYHLIPVDLPPEMPRSGGRRVSALEQKIHEAAGQPGKWFSIAVYGSRTGASQAALRIRKRKDWPWPVVPYAVTLRDEDERITGSELFVKILDVAPRSTSSQT